MSSSPIAGLFLSTSLVTGLAAGCRPAESGPVVAEVAARSSYADDAGLGGARDTTRASDDAGPRIPTPLPPPGVYRITMADRSNTCPAADGGAGAPAVDWVTFGPGEDGAWTAALPVNTGVGDPGLDRNFVRLEVGATTTSSFRPDRTCNWQVRRAMKVLAVTPTSLVVDIQAEYTDAVRCTLPRAPVSCTRDAVVTYTLVRPLCASGCAARPSVLADGGIEATCSCGDAGRP